MKNLATALLLLAAASTQGQIISQWTFENSFASLTGTGATLTGIAPEVGTGSASGVHASAATVWSSPSGNGSLHAFSANTWGVGDYWEFQTSTIGYSGLTLSYDQTSSNTGPGRSTLQFSTDGTTFTPIGAEYVILANAAPNAWNTTTNNPLSTFTYDLSGIPSLNNASTVYFRIVDTSTTSANGATVAAGGTDRIDNFTLSVPEPQSLTLLAGLALLGSRWFRRRAPGSKQA